MFDRKSIEHMFSCISQINYSFSLSSESAFLLNIYQCSLMNDEVHLAISNHLF